MNFPIKIHSSNRRLIGVWVLKRTHKSVREHFLVIFSEAMFPLLLRTMVAANVIASVLSTAETQRGEYQGLKEVSKTIEIISKKIYLICRHNKISK